MVESWANSARDAASLHRASLPGRKENATRQCLLLRLGMLGVHQLAGVSAAALSGRKARVAAHERPPRAPVGKRAPPGSRPP